MRTAGRVFCLLTLLFLTLGSAWSAPSGDTADEEPQQALRLAYPLVRRYKPAFDIEQMFCLHFNN